ncbi:hypothetical protein SAMN04488028_1145 [Reichenbachiella agariperforans]|uniref:PH domain-containing protein n=1 Tax=Reichenbachiella agariperforans TaxID=156994 RepID=A0A1M6WP39_REIAG|nr:hypothetical protein [Reichenbachiella agariperforans]SHK95359.1 hypothetical protein SAMN04488028_1145 [Reichenbachiella agariperforans]
MIKLKSDTTYIWGKGVVYYSLTLLIMIFLVKVTLVQALFLSMISLIFYLLINMIYAFSFNVESNTIEITNQLRPYYKEVTAFEDINSIEVKGVINKGITLAIDFKHKSKKYFAVTGISKEELEEIVEVFRTYKSGNMNPKEDV